LLTGCGYCIAFILKGLKMAYCNDTNEQLCREVQRLNITDELTNEILTRLMDLDEILFKFDLTPNSLYSELLKIQQVREIIWD
jgi:hypothetical protein